MNISPESNHWKNIRFLDYFEKLIHFGKLTFFRKLTIFRSIVNTYVDLIPIVNDSTIFVIMSKWLILSWLPPGCNRFNTLPGKNVRHRVPINVIRNVSNDAWSTGNLLCAAGSKVSRTNDIICDKSSLSFVYSIIACNMATKSCMAAIDLSELKLDKNWGVIPEEHALDKGLKTN